MPSEHVVAREGEIPEGERRIVQIGERQIGVFNVRGQYYALPNICIHQAGPLCEGRISGTLVAGVETGWKFEWGSREKSSRARGTRWSTTSRPANALRFPNAACGRIR